MKKAFFIPLYITLLFCFLSYNAFSQQTLIYKNPDANYKMAVELYEKQKYSAAQEMFFKLLNDLDENSVLKSNAEYYAAMCAIELFNNNAEYLFNEVLNNYPENSKVKNANFELANFEFKKRKYRKALEYYDKVDIYDLSQSQKSEYYFKTGYSYLKTDDIKKAITAFYKIIDDPGSSYYAPANYYYGHLQYADGNYETAIQSLRKIEDDETFKPIIPYYVIQIYYLQGKYEELITLAPKMLKSSTEKREPEIAHIAGDAMIRSGKYKEAIPYLELYEEKSRTGISREDNYQIAYAYYMTGDCDKSISLFEKVLQPEDSLAQNAYYHMADCFLKTGNKKSASSAFLSSYKLNYNKKISEDALFNYAKLAYEISYNPYNEAIKALQEYIQQFPDSPRIDEANRYLVNLFLTTKNYKNALEYIEKIKNKNAEYEAAYQKITYYRGIEFFNNYEYQNAIELLKKSQKYNHNKELLPESYYWIGEAYYRMGEYIKAISNYKEFQITTNAYGLSMFELSNYNLGYAYFKLKNYKEALVSFRRFLAKPSDQSSNIVKDAYIRSGDCDFIMKNYDLSIDQYDKALGISGQDNDYIMYQKALAFGVLSRFSDKINTLKEVVKQNGKSLYTDDALYEIATTYLVTDDNTNALKYFQKIIDEYPNSNYVVNSRLKSGLIYYNTDQNERALQILKDVVKDYPATPESKEALVNIRNIYIDMNKVDDYIAYTNGLPEANISSSSKDSLTYIAAENKYLEGDCEKSVPGFKSYIEKFPEGAFIISAYFYKAECDLRANRKEDALQGYLFVASKPNNQYTENAVAKAAELSFTSKDYEDALKLFIQLEKIAGRNDHIIISKEGMMKCYFILNDYDNAIKAAQDLLSTKKISDEIINLSHFTIARSAYALGKTALAQAEFDITSKLTKGSMGAESKYYLALIKFELGDYENAEKLTFEFIDEFSAYDYWLAKSFILLADIYTKTGDFFQAKQTLQSIIDNYEGADLVKEAYERQNAIMKMEKEAEKKQKEDLMGNDTIDNEDF